MPYQQIKLESCQITDVSLVHIIHLSCIYVTATVFEMPANLAYAVLASAYEFSFLLIPPFELFDCMQYVQQPVQACYLVRCAYTFTA